MIAFSILIPRLLIPWRDDSVSNVHQYLFPTTPSRRGDCDGVVVEVVSRKDEGELGGMIMLESELGRG